MSRDDDTIQQRTFSLEIRCNNAAFDGDANGNRVGVAEITVTDYRR